MQGTREPTSGYVFFLAFSVGSITLAFKGQLTTNMGKKDDQTRARNQGKVVSTGCLL